MAETWWGTRERPSGRMVQEILSMKRIFSRGSNTLFKHEALWDTDFTIHTTFLDILVDTNTPYWIIKYRMLRIESLPPKIEFDDEAVLKILYRKNPYEMPYAEYAAPDITNSPHTGYGGNRLDLSGAWNRTNSTAATMAAASVKWLRQWLYWSIYQSWPYDY